MRLSNWRCLIVVCSLCGALVASTLSTFAQDSKKTTEKKSEKSTAKKPAADPKVLPEGGIKELAAYIAELQMQRPAARTVQSYSAHFRLFMPGVIKAADRILELEPNAAQARAAKLQKLTALQGLVRWQPSASVDLEAWAKTLSQDKDPQIAKTGTTIWWTARTSNVATLGKLKAKELESLTDELFKFVEESGVDRTTFSLAQGFARSLERTSKYDSAAVVLERLQPLAVKSSDTRLADYATKLTGAIKRLKLPGNPIELTGTTADGKPFDMSQFKGKVVLIDFWASWCGPCIAELPNVETNYKQYHDKGFEIVGINMDRTRDAMDRFLAKRDVTWTQIVSFEDGKNSWSHPTATGFGINSIPSTMVVDQKGNVVSLGARGPELGRLLKQLLGDAAVTVPAGEK